MSARPFAASSRIANRPLVVVALMLSLFMAALEATVVSTAMPTVIGELGGIQRYAWVFTAYLLASTVTVPVFGKLADVFGRKPLLLGGIAVFLIGSIACAEATTMTELIVYRTIQGLGAGAMQPIAITVIGDLYDLEERARMQGLFAAVWGVAGIIGPTLGGVIVKYLHWKWIFLINVPFGVLAMFLIGTRLVERVGRREHALDVGGAVLLTGGILALLWGTGPGGSLWFGLPAAVTLLVAFIAVEARAADPILPGSLFRARVVSISSVAGALIGAALMTTVTYIPLYVQGVLGGSPTEAGATVAPLVVGWPVASTLGGRLIPRVGFRPIILVGMTLTVAGSLGIAMSLTPGQPLLYPKIATAVLGMGLGFANTALLIAVQTSVGWTQRGVATASTLFFRSIGGTLAVGILGGVLAGRLAAERSIPASVASELLSPHGRATMEPAIVARLTGALQHGLTLVFWVVAALAVAALVSSLLFPRVVPRASEATPGAPAPTA